MEIIEETTADGVVRQRFDLTVEDQTVPGLRWHPAGGVAPVATILIGHGGFQSKEAPNIVEMADQFARERGYATVALDAPGHGDRRTEAQVRQQEETLERLRTRGVDDAARRGREQVVSRTASATDAAGAPARPPRMSREWIALIDDLGPGRYGYWGVSMGARYGIPLLAAEPRISCAVLGLFGMLPDAGFRAQVESITVPLLFLFQHDDELMTPADGMALWEAFGSTEKTMHVNPGPHVGIPTFERDSSAAFYARHLG